MSDITITLTGDQLALLANRGYLNLTLAMQNASHTVDEAGRQGATYMERRPNGAAEARQELRSAPPRSNAPFPMTEAQERAIYAIGKSKGLSEDDLDEWVQGDYDLPSYKTLSKRQASEFIDSLKGISDAPRRPMPFRPKAAPVEAVEAVEAQPIDPDDLPFD